MTPRDQHVIDLAAREAQLKAQGRDLTKDVPPIGTDGESLRSHRGFEGISDAMLEERATFNLRDHMANRAVQVPNNEMGMLNLNKLSIDDLRALIHLAVGELQTREGDKD